ncbi:MAG: phosphoribosylglycinamide formyltransferase [Candidatus Peribacteraceae bacterium]
MHFIVLSSSQGSVIQATINAMNAGELTAVCAGLVTDREDRGCIEKAKNAGLPYRVVTKNEGESRETYDQRVHTAIEELFTETATRYPLPASRVIACMGWMWILSPWFIHQWNGRILNVHPALLPKFGGKGMYGHHVHEAVLAAHEKESGMTIHVMDEGVDTGKTLLQKSCPVLPDDTIETLCPRIGRLEKEWYPKVLQMIEKGEMTL